MLLSLYATTVWPFVLTLGNGFKGLAVCVCVLEKLLGLRCSMKICSEQPPWARRGWIRGKLFGGRGHNPICLFTLQQSQIRTIDTLGLVLESKYGSRRERGDEKRRTIYCRGVLRE